MDKKVSNGTLNGLTREISKVNSKADRALTAAKSNHVDYFRAQAQEGLLTQEYCKALMLPQFYKSRIPDRVVANSALFHDVTNSSLAFGRVSTKDAHVIGSVTTTGGGESIFLSVPLWPIVGYATIGDQTATSVSVGDITTKTFGGPTQRVLLNPSIPSLSEVYFANAIGFEDIIQLPRLILGKTAFDVAYTNGSSGTALEFRLALARSRTNFGPQILWTGRIYYLVGGIWKNVSLSGDAENLDISIPLAASGTEQIDALAFSCSVGGSQIGSTSGRFSFFLRTIDAAKLLEFPTSSPNVLKQVVSGASERASVMTKRRVPGQSQLISYQGDEFHSGGKGAGARLMPGWSDGQAVSMYEQIFDYPFYAANHASKKGFHGWMLPSSERELMWLEDQTDDGNPLLMGGVITTVVVADIEQPFRVRVDTILEYLSNDRAAEYRVGPVIDSFPKSLALLANLEAVMTNEGHENWFKKAFRWVKKKLANPQTYEDIAKGALKIGEMAVPMML